MAERTQCVSWIVNNRVSILISTSAIMKDISEESSSSDDEATRKALKEATDTQFLRESLFDKKLSERAEERSGTEGTCAEKYDEFGVSEGFKNFIAKKLSQLLDRNIVMTRRDISNKNSTKRKKNDDEEAVSGIRLVRSGAILEVVDTTAVTDECTCRPRKRCVKNGNTKDNNVKCKEAAVDPEHLLSKVETEFWSSRKKEIVYEYKKLPDGTLIEK